MSAQTPSFEEKTSALIRRAVNDGVIPGGVARIEDDGRIVVDAAAGWRDIEKRSPMESASIFDIRSITKPVTAIAALIQVAEGKIDLDMISDTA